MPKSDGVNSRFNKRYASMAKSMKFHLDLMADEMDGDDSDRNPEVGIREIYGKICDCGNVLPTSRTKMCFICRPPSRRYVPVRPATEERYCELDGCDKTFIWSSTANNQKYCSSECASLSQKAVSTRWLLFDRDGFRCNYCGRSPLTDPEVMLVADHIHPKALGGPNTMANLITSCRECNGGKHKKISTNVDELEDLVRERNIKQGICPSSQLKFGDHPQEKGPE